MEKPRNRLYLYLVSLVVLAIIGMLIIKTLHHSNSQKTQLSNINVKPAQDAINVVTKYLQAREDSVGADQASPTSWLGRVKSITTSSWYSQLQPSGSTQTSSVSSEYQVAHSKGYIVKASASNCFWSLEAMTPTANEGVMYCGLVDATVQRSTGNKLPAATLPFGWSRSGTQPAATLHVIKQNGNWLVDDDLSYE